MFALALEQDAVSDEVNHWNDEPIRSVYAMSDCAPFNPEADVLLVGYAFVPGSQQVRSLVERVSLGQVDKAIEVWCERKLRLQDGQPLGGPRFTKIPMRWERASGVPGME